MDRHKGSSENYIGKKQYRIIPSRYPTISFFENLVDPGEMDILFEIEGLTNNRLLQNAGEISLVSHEDRVCGPESTIVMAPFTHIGNASRFTDGSYGIYYAALTSETAIKETKYHREIFLGYTKEPACEIEMRCYVGTINRTLDDITGKTFNQFKSSDIATYPVCQKFAADKRKKGSFGLLYQSARDEKGQYVAGFMPTTVSIPMQGKHYSYKWNGLKIHSVREITFTQPLS